MIKERKLSCVGMIQACREHKDMDTWSVERVALKFENQFKRSLISTLQRHQLHVYNNNITVCSQVILKRRILNLLGGQS